MDNRTQAWVSTSDCKALLDKVWYSDTEMLPGGKKIKVFLMNLFKMTLVIAQSMEIW